MLPLILPRSAFIKAVSLLLLATTCGLSASEAGAASSPPRPNILLIVADDLGYGEMSCQGNPQVPTPNIDSIAKNGVRFTNGYVSGTYCSPSRAALMTGRYQERFGHEFNPGPISAASVKFGLPLDLPTIAERFKSEGYATAMFGKWHLGLRPEFTPPQRGFDEYFGFLGGMHDYFRVGVGSNALVRGSARVPSVDYTTTAFGRETVKFIDRHPHDPWFVYLAFNAVHEPLEAPETEIQRFATITDSKRRTFAAMLSMMDQAVGDVLAKLAAQNALENTLIFFISDNGGPTNATTSSNGPLRGFKMQTWEGGIRVPWMVQWKGHLPAGQVDDRPVIQLDIMPTALAAAGVTIKTEWKLDGVNLLPFLAEKNSASPHDSLYWRFGEQIAVRRGAWKLVKALPLLAAIKPQRTATTDGAQLYNLVSDLGEKKDLAAEHPEKVRELAAAWNEWNKDLVPPAWQPEDLGRGKRKAAPPEN